MKYYKTEYQSSLGKLTLVSDGHSLVGLWIEGQKYFESTIDGEIVERDNLNIFTETKNWLDRYFKGEKPLASELSLSPKGSPFRQKVWSILCNIPYGKTVTYKEIAKKLGRDTMSAQAVGGAVGHNPISIIIPCHRVIGSDGSMVGYAGGIDRKVWLLKHEGFV
ncbi:methylated-DNA--[protein]-cysteine S-methyltransferase [Candidatus Dojkabacteria bacterium]|uniref:Methylated-DNA--protein-cysteine methyltransferase n=1 Tax=Candidatus Dojkabacteria bacterium TaxID=2099670 RepID=A0A847VCW8_9BACT|nr:methylated-DNA--[protein]-cysteine S-methyltransferase [Candidatus Dojkabacteria bacterium]